MEVMFELPTCARFRPLPGASGRWWTVCLCLHRSTRRHKELFLVCSLTNAGKCCVP